MFRIHQLVFYAGVALVCMTVGVSTVNKADLKKITAKAMGVLNKDNAKEAEIQEKMKQLQEQLAEIEIKKDVAVAAVVDTAKAKMVLLLDHVLQYGLAVGRQVKEGGSWVTKIGKPDNMVSEKPMSRERAHLCSMHGENIDITDKGKQSHDNMENFVDGVYMGFLRALHCWPEDQKEERLKENFQKKAFADAAAVWSIAETMVECSTEKLTAFDEWAKVQATASSSFTTDERLKYEARQAKATNPFLMERREGDEATKLKNIEDQLLKILKSVDDVVYTALGVAGLTALNADYENVCAGKAVTAVESSTIYKYMVDLHNKLMLVTGINLQLTDAIQKTIGEDGKEKKEIAYDKVFHVAKFSDLLHATGFAAIGLASNLERCPGWKTKNDQKKEKKEGIEQQPANFHTGMTEVLKTFYERRMPALEIYQLLFDPANRDDADINRRVKEVAAKSMEKVAESVKAKAKNAKTKGSH